jgi:hypothetical protein
VQGASAFQYYEFSADFKRIKHVRAENYLDGEGITPLL